MVKYKLRYHYKVFFNFLETPNLVTLNYPFFLYANLNLDFLLKIWPDGWFTCLNC
jgi:hypothetical protein